jgi:hypothetical protein
MRATCLAHIILLDLKALIIFYEEVRHLAVITPFYYYIPLRAKYSYRMF